MKISIALCTFNGSKHISEQLDSIAAQTRRPDELVVCDDRSMDETVDAINKFISTAQFPVRLSINENNLGYIKNFEKAMGLCEGDIIALSDQDDIWDPKKLKMIEETFSKSPGSAAIFSDAEAVDHLSRPLGYTLWQSIRFSKREKKLVRDRRAFEVLLRYNLVAGMTLAFRSAYKKQLFPIPAPWMHDAWIAIMASALGDLTMIEEPLVKYRQHGGQQIGSSRRLTLADDLPEALNLSGHGRKSSIALDRAAFGALEERLSSVDGLSSDKMSRLEEKLKHLDAREQMASIGRLKRIPLASKELMAMRYDLYSNGFLYFVDDLIF